MILEDIVKDKDYPLIMYRINSPFEDEEDTLFGYCQYINGELISLDGDSYSLKDIIEKSTYDIENQMLIVWEKVEWSYTAG